MKRINTLSIVFAAAFGICIAACSRRPASQPVAAGALARWNVLLVTIDTLRADRVGAYGSALGATPTLDRLAAEGVRVERAYAHVPLTLPSHATILTGLYPFANGVRDNGTFRLEGRPTLAHAFKSAGYRTAAFVGAFVLDARFGLNAGFDLYDDRMQGSGAAFEVVERPAEQVLDPAGRWIGSGAGHSGQGAADRWFAWIHLYDPHEPYAAPEPYGSRYSSDPYLGEIAYVDHALGSFIDRLQSSHALDRTLIVVMADHGESLGEHGERTHGLFAYDATLRVPLILWSPPALPPGVVPSARLVDVAPTILDLVGLAPPQQADGRSIRARMAGERRASDEPSYFEALNANLARNWAPLKGIIAGSLKLIDLPVPELYDLDADPGETRNIYASAPDRARPLERALDQLPTNVAAAAAPRRVDPDAEQRLRSLGYVVGAQSRPSRAYTAADDPKRLVHLNNALDEAAALWGKGEASSAIETLRRVIAERADLTIAYDRLAHMLRATGRLTEAVSVLDAAARGGHADRSLLRSLGSMLADAGDLSRSAAVLEPLVRQDDRDLQSIDALGQTYTRMRRSADAEKLFRRVLDGSPNTAATWNNLGALYLISNRNADAAAAFSRAIAIDPLLAGAHNGLGVAHARQGDVNRAVEEWREALRIRPDFEDARANLARVGAREER